jgi:hypothetical protein
MDIGNYLFWLQPLFKLWSKFDYKLDLVCSNCDPCQYRDENLVIGWTLLVLVMTSIRLAVEILLWMDCRNPILRKCEDETHTPKMGTWELSGTPKTLEFDCRGQNTSHWGVLYIIVKLLKWKCRKWAHMSRLVICSTSYGKKKGRESNWQFDSRSLKVRNRPNPDACMWSATHRWKALDESYNFSLCLVPIRGLSKELLFRKVAGVRIVAVSRFLLGCPRIKNHLDVGVMGSCRK